MPLFKWKDEFSVKVKRFDDQHKNLIAVINDLHDAMRAGKSSEVLGKIFNNLIEYTSTHFGEEEEYMQKFGYSKFNEHKKEHDELIKQVTELKKKFDNKQMFLSIELMNFLKEWLMHHIMKTDRDYGPFLNDKGVY